MKNFKRYNKQLTIKKQKIRDLRYKYLSFNKNNMCYHLQCMLRKIFDKFDVLLYWNEDNKLKNYYKKHINPLVMPYL